MWVIGGFEVFGDQRGVFIASGIPLLNDVGHASVQLGTPCLELRLVGDRADQRVPKSKLGVRGESHLIDQFHRHELGESFIGRPVVPEHNCEYVRPEPRPR
ncbi:Uncharacterised protein [Mycobacterium tuberculosis]|nr:Uncharacterised protein [Mycobacterium tuberculosis]